MVERWRRGDCDAATSLCNCYFEQLLFVIDGRLARRFRARFDAADVCQSALRSMFRRVKDPKYTFERDAGVWSFLLEIALNKLHNRIRHESAQKCSPRRELAQPAEDDGDTAGLFLGLSREPNSEDAAEFRDLLAQIFRRLTRAERRYLVLQMRGYSQQEIARRLDLCTRTIRRMPLRIQQKAADLLT
jgi:RNA polymerase sigma factor (sigma-70 family)